MWEVNAPYLLDGEEFIYKDDCTSGKGLSLMGGVLFLTSQRLVFKSRSTLIQSNEEISVFLRDIAEIKLARTPIGIPAGFTAVTKNGTSFKYVVRKRQQWMDMVREQIARVNAAGNA